MNWNSAFGLAALWVAGERCISRVALPLGRGSADKVSSMIPHGTTSNKFFLPGIFLVSAAFGSLLVFL